MGSQNNKPTLVSLARELGVSRQTISNVINAPHLVKAETLERVRAAIERSGYRPSALGRALRTNRSMNLALRVHTSEDDINGNVMDRFLHSLADAARAASYRITIFTAVDSDAEIAELDGLRAVNAVDGCILTDTTERDDRPRRLAELGCPFVAFGRPWGQLPGTHAWVDVDCATGTRDATLTLHRSGHTRIGFLGWGPGLGTGADRRGGWREAVDGLVPDPDDLSLQVEDGVAAGRAAAAELRRRGATAVVCASDSLALGALPEFARTDDPFVPVVGFDDTPVTRALGVSSVAQPVDEAARFCVATLVGLLRGEVDPAEHQQLLTPRLKLRERVA
nr:LacI family transcriptional regulator [Propionibacterium sp.]